jgi:hypothetical protein
VQPQRITATATVSGLDGLFHPTSEAFTLSHNPGQAATPRVNMRRLVLPQVKSFNVSVTRTGIPINETFMLFNISRLGFAPGSGAPSPSASGDHSYIVDHVGQLESLSVDTGRIDSPLLAERNNVFPGRQRTGYTLFARQNKNDPCMPFSDPSAAIDVSRFITAIFGGLSDALAQADVANTLFSLGGQNNDGNFEMFLVPHAQHSTFIDFGTPWNGFTLIFKGTIKAGLVSANVFVPLSVLFVRTPGLNGNASLDARIDLLDAGNNSDDRTRITVEAEGTLPDATASLIRQKLVDAMSNLSPTQKERVIQAIGLFAASLNSLRPNQGQSPIPEDVRVVMFPNPRAPLPMNRVAPAGNLQPTLCVLQSTP